MLISVISRRSYISSFWGRHWARFKRHIYNILIQILGEIWNRIIKFSPEPDTNSTPASLFIKNNLAERRHSSTYILFIDKLGINFVMNDQSDTRWTCDPFFITHPTLEKPSPFDYNQRWTHDWLPRRESNQIPSTSTLSWTVMSRRTPKVKRRDVVFPHGTVWASQHLRCGHAAQVNKQKK